MLFFFDIIKNTSEHLLIWNRNKTICNSDFNIMTFWKPQHKLYETFDVKKVFCELWI